MEVKELFEEWIRVNEKLKDKLNEFNLLKEERDKIIEMSKKNGVDETLLNEMNDSVNRCKVLAKEINELKKEASRLRELVK